MKIFSLQHSLAITANANAALQTMTAYAVKDTLKLHYMQIDRPRRMIVFLVNLKDFFEDFDIILLSAISISLAVRTPSIYYHNDLFDYSPNDEYTLPKNFDDADNGSPVHFQGDVKQAKILTLENKNHGKGKFKYSIQTQNGIELTQVGKLKDDKTFVVSGSYSYTGADGRRYRVRYTADELGYHPITELDVEIPEIKPQTSTPKQFAPSQFNFGQKRAAPVFKPPVKNALNNIGVSNDNAFDNEYFYKKPKNQLHLPRPGPDRHYLPVY